MKRIISIIMVMVLALTAFAACKKETVPSEVSSEVSSSVASETEKSKEPSAAPESSVKEKPQVKLGVLKGPTGIGASYLLEQNANGKSLNSYEVQVVAEATDIVSQVASGNLDIAAVPTNVASSLYNKTEGGVKILALNTSGVLYILEKGDSIKEIKDLKGKTIYATGQGANPEYVLNYILTQNGLEPGKDVTIEFMDSAALVTEAASGNVDIAMLPVPAVTTVLVKNQEFRSALSLSKEWDKLNNGSVLTMGCIIARKEFIENNPEAIDNFLKEYEVSINYVKANPKESGEFCEKFEIVPAAAIATKAIPDCNLIFVKGEEIKEYLAGYYQILFEADPKSIGGKIPADDIYEIR
ncbi:MAG: ABC transporter substrate-binding protein [Clostridia bacterium]|nr:ABC transporter substrate-binding protein [Clostridia bacterium]